MPDAASPGKRASNGIPPALTPGVWAGGLLGSLLHRCSRHKPLRSSRQGNLESAVNRDRVIPRIESASPEPRLLVPCRLGRKPRALGSVCSTERETPPDHTPANRTGGVLQRGEAAAFRQSVTNFRKRDDRNREHARSSRRRCKSGRIVFVI